MGENKVAVGNQEWTGDIPHNLGHFDRLINGTGMCTNPRIDLQVIKDEILQNKSRIHLKNVGVGSTVFVDNTLQPEASLIRKGPDIIVKYVAPGTRTIKAQNTESKEWQQDIAALSQKRVEVEVAYP